MDGQYDPTDSVSAFAFRDNEQAILTGPVNDNGNESRVIITKSTLPDGRIIRDVYEKVGTLFENENTDGNKPLFSGPYKERRIAFWAKEKDGVGKYLSGKIEDKRVAQDAAPQSSAPLPDGPLDDSIPF